MLLFGIESKILFIYYYYFLCVCVCGDVCLGYNKMGKWGFGNGRCLIGVAL